MRPLLTLVFITFALTSCRGKTDDLSVLKNRCLSCHNLAPICFQLGKRDFNAWKTTVEAMKKAGAKISASEGDRLAAFLSNQGQDAAFCK